MMSGPRRPARVGFGIARDMATKTPAATIRRIVDPHVGGVTPECVVNFMSCSFSCRAPFESAGGELLVYALVARAALPNRSRSAVILARFDATYAASCSPSRLISTLANAPRAPA